MPKVAERGHKAGRPVGIGPHQAAGPALAAVDRRADQDAGLGDHGCDPRLGLRVEDHRLVHVEREVDDVAPPDLRVGPHPGDALLAGDDRGDEGVGPAGSVTPTMLRKVWTLPDFRSAPSMSVIASGRMPRSTSRPSCASSVREAQVPRHRHRPRHLGMGRAVPDHHLRRDEVHRRRAHEVATKMFAGVRRSPSACRAAGHSPCSSPRSGSRASSPRSGRG
jgi:hypothetical protein